MDKNFGALERPVVNISIDNSTFEKVTLTKYKSVPIITLYLMVQNLSGEKQRRFAIYDLIEEIVKYLLIQDLGLELQDHLRPLGYTNVTDKKFADAGYQVYSINFLASFIFEKEPEEDEQDEGRLNKIVNDYFLVRPNEKIESTSVVTTEVVADFSGTPLVDVPTDELVAFTDLSTGSPTSWSWSFGDGGTSTSQNPTHAYAAEGTYTVTLTASKTGSSDTETKTAYVAVVEGLK